MIEWYMFDEQHSAMGENEPRLAYLECHGESDYPARNVRKTPARDARSASEPHERLPFITWGTVGVFTRYFLSGLVGHMEHAMRVESDVEYPGRRIEEEREKAEHADNPAGYRMHTDFAREYERRLQALIADQPVSAPVNGHVA